MDAKNIGRIIKEARLAKKMTQNEVVGDFITRNMLSQIESGSAMPSVKTLEYLCKVLDIQIEAYDSSPVADGGMMGYIELRNLYAAGVYEEVIHADPPAGYVDEFTALKARACLHLAEQLTENEDITAYQRAVELARESKELSTQGIFADIGSGERADSVIKKAAAKLSAYYSSLV